MIRDLAITNVNYFLSRKEEAWNMDRKSSEMRGSSTGSPL